MAQWAGQESGNTPASRVEEAERALAHAVAVLRLAPSPQNQKALKSIVNLAKRILSARTQVLKARLFEGSPMRSKAALSELGETALRHRIDDLQSGGVAGILAEFGVGDLTFIGTEPEE